MNLSTWLSLYMEHNLKLCLKLFYVLLDIPNTSPKSPPQHSSLAVLVPSNRFTVVIETCTQEM